MGRTKALKDKLNNVTFPIYFHNHLLFILSVTVAMYYYSYYNIIIINKHDPTLMRDIAKIKDGSFYYISNLRLVEECFIDAVVGLFSVIAQDIKLTIQAKQLQFSNDLRISKAYGNWEFDGLN